MVYFSGRSLSMVLSVISISVLAAYTKEVASDVKDLVGMKKIFLPSNLSAPDVDLADFMPMDATQGTTPAACSPGMTCGFQHFARVRGEFAYFPFLHYCRCADDEVCVEKGINNYRCFYFYKCQSLSELMDAPTPPGIRNATEISELGVSATSMVPQNAATEPGQPVTFNFGNDPFPPSLNC